MILRLCRFYSTAYFIHVVVKPCPHFIKQAGNATTLPIAVSQNVCQKPLERGSCARKRARYFYNAEKSRCENFGACPVDGDVNNFATKEECVAKCQSDSPFVQVGNAATLPIAVSQSPSIKVGIAVTLPLALNDNSAAVAVLTPVAQSGSPNAGESCLEPKVVGLCKGAFLRFHFDRASRKCKPFLFGGERDKGTHLIFFFQNCACFAPGCQGNGNNFASQELCDQECGVHMVDADSSPRSLTVDSKAALSNAARPPR